VFALLVMFTNAAIGGSEKASGMHVFHFAPAGLKMLNFVRP
jgi:hypothetical protein